MKNTVRWDPFRTMTRWDPLTELRTMQHEMDRLFDRFFGAEHEGKHAMLWMPSAEGYVKDSQLVLRAELPGVDSKDLDVSITDRELIIKGERKAEKSAKDEEYVYREINYGSFERRFVLPEGAKTDELKAAFSNGILEITMPVAVISLTRKIEIGAPKEEKEKKEHIETDMDIAA